MRMLGIVFTIIGVVFLAVGIGLQLSSTSIYADSFTTSGRVIEVSGGTPVVTFQDSAGGNHSFRGAVRTNPPRHSVGQVVKVTFPQGRPEAAKLDDFLSNYLLTVIFGGIGLLFFAIGGGILLTRFRRKRSIAQLLSHGIPIQAKYIETYRDQSLKINGRSPYRVAAQAVHPATGKLQQFKSEMLWVDPSQAIAGQSLTVMVDPSSPKRHYMDLSDLIAAD